MDFPSAKWGSIPGHRSWDTSSTLASLQHQVHRSYGGSGMKSFELQENELRMKLFHAPIINRGEWQAQTGLPDNMRTPELRHVQVMFKSPELPHELIEMV